MGDSINRMAPHHHVNFYHVIDETITLLNVKQLGSFAPGSNPGLRSHSVVSIPLLYFVKKVGILLNAKLQRMSTLRKQKKKTAKKRETFLGSVESS